MGKWGTAPSGAPSPLLPPFPIPRAGARWMPRVTLQDPQSEDATAAGSSRQVWRRDLTVEGTLETLALGGEGPLKSSCLLGIWDFEKFKMK